MKMKYLFLFTFVAISLSSCIKDEVDKEVRAYTVEEHEILSQNLDLPIEALDYTLQLPQHLGSSRVVSNKHQATLGRVLFYDKKLTKNESISCASCHEAEKAFADGKAFSEASTRSQPSVIHWHWVLSQVSMLIMALVVLLCSGMKGQLQ